MTERINCPVCGESVEAAPGGPCPACGAILSEDAFTPAAGDAGAAGTGGIESLPSESSALDASTADELVRAFRSQFEDNKVHLPAQWVDRLRRLATDIEESRRMASVLFVDLRGYTRLSSELEEQQLEELRRWFYEVCTRRVELHGGFVIQILGDAIFAAFGAPWSFERDTESCIRALLDIGQDIRDKGSFEGHELSIRSGAATGTINVRLVTEQGRPRPDLFGPTVNLAARLEAQADTWEILISDSMADQVRDVFDLEPREPFTPKNYHREVRPEVVLRHKGAAARRRGADPDFVGRARELERLSSLLAGVARGEFGALRVTGEAGSGKSRLIRQALDAAAREGLTCIRIEHEPHDRHVLLKSMTDLLRGLGTGRAESSGAEAVLEDLRAAVPDLDPALVANAGYLLGVEKFKREFASIPGDVLRTQVIGALVSILTRAAAHRPFAVFIDDLQWGDRLSLEVLEKLHETKPPGLGIVVGFRALGDQRSADQDPFQSADDTEPVYSQVTAAWPLMEAEPLPPADRRALVAQIVDVETIHPLLRRRLLEETEGIPLYMIELAREAAVQPADAPLAEVASAHVFEKDFGISPVVLDVLQARIDRLSRQKRALLQSAAILGRRFTYQLMRVFESVGEALLSELYALKGVNMLEDERLPADLAFYFTPTVLRDVAYQMLTPKMKTQLHTRAAERIQGVFTDPADDMSFELAFHWIRAEEIGRARPHLRRAAQRALDKGLPHEAYDLLTHALRTQVKSGGGEDADDTPLARQQLGLLEDLAGRVSRMMGDYERSAEHLNRFLETARDTGNAAWEATARHQLALGLLEQGDFARAEAHLEAALSAVTDREAVRARIRNAMGVVRLRTGRLDEALAEFRSIGETFGGTAQPDRVAADAWNNAGLVHWHRGEFDAAREAFERALGLWRGMEIAFGEIQVLSNLGIIAEKQARHADAADLYAKAGARAEEIGYLHGISAVEANLSNLYLLARRWPEAEAHARRSLHAARMIGHGNSEAIALENLGLALAGKGSRDEAAAQLEAAENLGTKMNDPMRAQSARLARAWAALFGGDPATAEALLQDTRTDSVRDLNLWRETITGGLESLGGGDVAALVASLAELERTASAEDVLRRVEVIDLVANGSLDAASKDRLARLRQTLEPANLP